MRINSFHRVSAIRQQARAGRTTAELATAFGLDCATVEKIVACRTREAAAQVLDTKDGPELSSVLMLSGGYVVDFSNLIQWREK